MVNRFPFVYNRLKLLVGELKVDDVIENDFIQFLQTTDNDKNQLRYGKQ